MNKMLKIEIRHELKSLAQISETLISQERRKRNQVVLQNFTKRCFDIIDKICEEYLK